MLFLSRIHEKKGLDLLIPAFAAARTGDAVLLLAGPDVGGYLATVEQMIRSAGIERRVIYANMLTGRTRLAALGGSDLFVLPSYQENFGIVVVEALAAGTPVLISDQVNIHRHISQVRGRGDPHGCGGADGGTRPLDVRRRAPARRGCSRPGLRLEHVRQKRDRPPLG